MILRPFLQLPNTAHFGKGIQPESLAFPNLSAGAPELANDNVTSTTFKAFFENVINDSSEEDISSRVTVLTRPFHKLIPACPRGPIRPDKPKIAYEI